MIKPIPRVIIEELDYNECAAYIGNILGYDLNDTLGKFGKNPPFNNIEYRNFWHFLCNLDIIEHNGSLIYLPEIENLV